MSELDSKFWNDLYLEEDTGWNVGYASYPITAYFDQLEDKELDILIPGAGNAYEVEYLYHNKFRNVNLLDWSEKAIENFKDRLLYFPEKNMHQQDFFEHEGKYDIIVEQTFFCALNPELREKYAEQCAQLLKEDGILVGVLFAEEFEKEGPPFGGNQEEYRNIFEGHFEIERLEKAYNSIDPRDGRELFIKFRKQS